MKKYLFIALVAFLAVTSASAQLRIKMGKNSPIEKLGRAEIAITNLYVDSVDENKLVEDAIRGMLEKLDPHSSYATAKETKAMNEPLNGSFDGIGVQFNMVDDTLLVIQLRLRTDLLRRWESLFKRPHCGCKRYCHFGRQDEQGGNHEAPSWS